MKNKIDKYTCDKCKTVVEIERKSFGTKQPAGWATVTTLPNVSKMFCNNCKESYDREYLLWFNAWMEAGK
jgi:hypothetical protein